MQRNTALIECLLNYLPYHAESINESIFLLREKIKMLANECENLNDEIDDKENRLLKIKEKLSHILKTIQSLSSDMNSIETTLKKTTMDLIKS